MKNISWEIERLLGKIEEFFGSGTWTVLKVIFCLEIILFVLYVLVKSWLLSGENRRMEFLNQRRNKPYDPYDVSLSELYPDGASTKYPWFYYNGEYYKEGTIVKLNHERLIEYIECALKGVGIYPFKRAAACSPYARFLFSTGEGKIGFTIVQEKPDGSYEKCYANVGPSGYDRFDIFISMPEEYIIEEIVQPVKFIEKEEKDILLNWTAGNTATNRVLSAKFRSLLIPYVFVAAVLVIMFTAVDLGIPVAAMALAGLIAVIAFGYNL